MSACFDHAAMPACNPQSSGRGPCRDAMFYRGWLLLLALSILPVAIAHAQSSSPGHLRSIEAQPTSTPPIIDGTITQQEWGQAQIADNFWLSAEQKAPSEQTEVYVLADQTHLYLAFRCYDRSPGKIERSRYRRDKGLGFDDHVVVEIDPFHNHREISKFSVNALGTQNYTVAGGSAAKIEWKGDWRAAAQVTQGGWTVEMAIPFEILKFRADQGNFGINFLRYQHRSREWSSWADTTPQAKADEMGHLLLDLPASAERNNPWTFMPYVYAARNAFDKEGEFQEELTSAGADIRYEPTRDSTALLSVNPDFSDLESQITDIDFNDNEKRTDDIRPFFEEGRAFITPSSDDELYFYSNRVPDFDLGGKYFSRQENSQLGLLLTEDPFDRKDFTARYRYEVDDTHQLSSMLVGTDREDLENELLMLRFSGKQDSGINYRLESAQTATDDTDDEIEDGGMWLGTLGWSGDYWWVSSDADRFETDFFPANGLQDTDTIGTEAIKLGTGYYRSYSNKFITEVEFSLSRESRDTLDGLTQRRIDYIGGSIETEHQIRTGLFYTDGDYRPVEGDRGEYADELRHDYFWTLTLDFNTRSNWLGYGMAVSDGFLGGDDYYYVTGYLWVKPSKSTLLNVSAEELDNFGETNQVVINGSWDLSAYSSLLFRYVRFEDDEFNRLAYRKTVSDGMDIFMVYNDDTGAETNYSVKLLWTFN
jgi:hypothetical protein